MAQIILTPEQAKQYHEATEPVLICDHRGKILGVLRPAANPVQVCDTNGNVLGEFDQEYSAEILAELKRRAKAPGRRFTSAQVTRHMQALAEIWEREGPFDQARLTEILEQLRAEDAA